ncbi:hypothetical protein [Mycobacteroides abscessus]|uniref:hypothetical protein n=1 Tax=Mycobacteroides abscessus TaxID=36809 RepID=UPI000C266362|nr:hypothetical protein [Mycobacteroides abscessus]
MTAEIESILAQLPAVQGLREIDGGVHVRTRSDGQFCIDVLRTFFNYRIVLSYVEPDGSHFQYKRGWCYFGHGEDARGEPRTMATAHSAALLAALAWDGYGEPGGFDKRTFTAPAED